MIKAACKISRKTQEPDMRKNLDEKWGSLNDT